MVIGLARPERPLPPPREWRWKKGAAWTRIWHHDRHTQAPDRFRLRGPLHRLDPHTDPAPDRPVEEPRAARECPEGRGVLYLGRRLEDSAAEVFGDRQRSGLVQICPAWRVSKLRAMRDERLADLRGDGAMRVGALPQLAIGELPRARTQEWARAVYEDFPGLSGIVYPGAYISGNCIALWERAGALEIAGIAETPQELPLHYPEIWQRLVTFLQTIRISAVEIPREHCPRCRAGTAAGQP